MDSTVFTTFEDGQYIAGTDEFSSIFVRYTDFDTAQEQSATLMNAISTETAYIPFISVAFDPEQNPEIEMARTIGNVLGMLGVIALVVSGFLVVNVINAIVVEQKRQIGVMKSLGATRLG